MLEAAFVAGLASEGVVVHRLGVVPTPAVAFEAARRNCLGAVISASHNPYHDNGIKLFARGGTQAPRRRRAAHRGRRRRRSAGADRRPGPARRRRGQPGLRRPRRSASIEGRRLDGLRIVVDAANGAASAIGRRRCWRRPAPTSIAIHDRPDGRNINAGCGATDTASLAAAVRRARRRPRPRPRRRRRPADRRRPHRRGSSTATTSSRICAIDLPRRAGCCATTPSS